MSTRNSSGISCARSYRTLRDGSFEGRFPRHFVPGYDHAVPLGPTPPLHHSTTPPLHHSTTPPLHHSTTPPLHHSRRMSSSKISRRDFVSQAALLSGGLVSAGLRSAQASEAPSESQLRVIFATDAHLMVDNRLRSADALRTALS